VSGPTGAVRVLVATKSVDCRATIKVRGVLPHRGMLPMAIFVASLRMFPLPHDHSFVRSMPFLRPDRNTIRHRAQ
jgi:hypothetical protein